MTTKQKVAKFKAHLKDVACWFNEASRECNLGVKISSKEAERAAEGSELVAAIAYCDGQDDSGILHKEQVRTAVRATREILVNPLKAGLILGAMQSGKTTTSLALQFAGPVFYLVKGQPLYPVFLLTVHTSNAAQTRHELERFLGFYSQLQFVADDDENAVLPLAKASEIAETFRMVPSLEIYRQSVLRRAFNDFESISASPEEFFARRSTSMIDKIADRIEAIIAQGFAPVMIIDEPQFGVMDRLLPNSDTGEVERKDSVFKRILREIEQRLKINPGQHALIATSATPYEIYNIDGVWVVNQELGETYLGFNFFAGVQIDPNKIIKPPGVVSLTEFGHEVGVSDLSSFSLAAMESEAVYLKRRKKLGLTDKTSHSDYRKMCIGALREALVKIAQREASSKFGVCIRAKNHNELARSLTETLRLDEIYDVMHYSGADAGGKSVKRFVNANHKNERLPYLLVVTNRARMGDAFPNSTKYFIELAERFSDMNAMFQGFVGRACGYGKDSTVILSDRNKAMIKDIQLVEGRYVYRPSHGSIIIGTPRRGRPRTLLEIKRDRTDHQLEKLFRRIDRFVETRLVSVRSAKLRSKRSSDSNTATKYAPLLKDMEALDIFAYAEANRKRLWPELPELRILRPGERVDYKGTIDDRLTYSTDPNGGCQLTLREDVGASKQGGVRARGETHGEHQYHLEPQILLRKHDPKTGAVIRDKDAEDRKAGDWQVYSIILPLKEPVRPLVSSPETLPLPHTVFDDHLEGEQRERRDEAVAVKTARRRGPK